MFFRTGSATVTTGGDGGTVPRSGIATCALKLQTPVPTRMAPAAAATYQFRRTRRNWYVAAAAGAILVGTGVWSFSAHVAIPERGTVPPSPPVVTVALPVRKNITNRTELTGQFSAVNQVGLRAQVSGYLTEIHFQDGQIV